MAKLKRLNRNRVKIQYPKVEEARYRVRLVAFVDDVYTAIADALLPQLQPLIDERANELGYNKDGFVERLAKLLASVAVTAHGKEPGVVKGLAPLAEAISGKNLLNQNKAAKVIFGVDIYKNDPKLKILTNQWSAENGKLITSVVNEALEKTTALMNRAVNEGRTTADVAKELASMGEVSKSRAELIARTETAKLNSQITQYRQRSVGIEYYEWSATSDERTRDSHDVMDGRLCRWDDPTVYSPDNGKTWVDRGSGEKQHPGESVQCRCVSYPKFPDELENE